MSHDTHNACDPNLPSSPTVRDYTTANQYDKMKKNAALLAQQNLPVTRIGQTLQPTLPTQFRQIKNAWDQKEWLEAIHSEINNHKKRKTYRLVPREPWMFEIQPKDIFKLKYNGSDFIKRKYRAAGRKGFSQTKGVNFDETYAPVADWSSKLMGLNLALLRRWKINIVDVTTAFINTDLHEKMKNGDELPRSQRIFMKPSALWKELLKIPDNFTMELLKCINGLKQSGYRFFKEVVEWLLSLEYTQSKVDLCVFFNYDDNGNLILVIIIHVDDILYTGITIAMEKFAKELRKKFETTDPKDINGEMFLGHFITYNPDKGVLTLSLTHYIEQALETFNMANCNTARTPWNGTLLTRANGTAKDDEEKASMKTFSLTIRNQIGSLNYISGHVRGDLKAYLTPPARNVNNPGQKTREAINQIWRYLKQTKDYVLRFDRNIKPGTD